MWFCACEGFFVVCVCVVGERFEEDWKERDGVWEELLGATRDSAEEWWWWSASIYETCSGANREDETCECCNMCVFVIVTRGGAL